LATDEAPTVAVIKHALEWLDAERLRVEVIVTLQPTSPLRTAREIDTAVGLLDEPGIDSAVSVASIGLPVSVVGWIEGDRYRGTLSSMSDLRRQGSPVAVRLTGGIYVTRRELIEKNRIMGERPAALLVNERSAIDVDTLSDLRAVRRIIGHRS
jgi:CMP-N-acetylneuraminic acid synthetase